MLNLIKELSEPEVIKNLKHHNIRHIRLTGSFSDGTNTEDSDIDLLYEFDTSKNINGRGPISAKVFLEKKFGKMFDLLDKDYLPTGLNNHVFSSLIPIR